MLKGGKVSVWVGDIGCEDELLSYVDDGPFGIDFDFEVNPKFGRELKAERQAIDLEYLLSGI